MLCFDIETCPLSEEVVLAAAGEFIPPPHPGEFDAGSVKLGNLKDQAKIEAKIAEARAAHEAAVSQHAQAVEQSRQSWVAEQMDRAPLSPITGRVLAIGYWSATKQAAVIDHGGDRGCEVEMITNFWGQYRKMRQTSRRVVGVNIFGFDLPFLIRRSWILGIDDPPTIRQDYRWWDKLFIDLREIWLLGQKWGDCPSSLDHMARSLGCGQKPEDCDGAQFHKLWLSGDPEQREKARQYLLNDLEMTWRVAERLGVI